MDVTGKVSEFIVNTSFKDIPAPAVAKAKLAILDCLGVILIGSSDEASRNIGQMVRDYGSLETACVIGQGFRTSIADAAFVNGFSAHVLDYDDSFSPVPLHPSAPVLPAAIAVTEVCKESGQKIIEACIIGYEIETKLAEILTLAHFQKGWHATGTLGTLGAAAACCKVLNLDLKRTKTALGIAVSMAAGTRENFGTMTKPLHVADAAKNGALAAILAKRGIDASLNILDGKFGFFRLYGDDAVEIESRHLDKLGLPYSIVSPGFSIKLHSSCVASHSTIDGIIKLVTQNSIPTDEVETIECTINPLCNENLKYIRPRTGYEGKFSLEFCVATAFLKRKVLPSSFSSLNVKDPDVIKLMEKVKRLQWPEGETTPRLTAKINIVMKNNKNYSCKIDYPKGSPENPVTGEDLINKISYWAETDSQKKIINALAGKIENFETLEDIEELMGLLA